MNIVDLNIIVDLNQHSWFNYGLLEICKPDKSLFALPSLNMLNIITFIRSGLPLKARVEIMWCGKTGCQFRPLTTARENMVLTLPVSFQFYHYSQKFWNYGKVQQNVTEKRLPFCN